MPFVLLKSDNIVPMLCIYGQCHAVQLFMSHLYNFNQTVYFKLKYIIILCMHLCIHVCMQVNCMFQYATVNRLVEKYNASINLYHA